MTSSDEFGLRTDRQQENNELNECIFESSPEKSPNTDRQSRHTKKRGTTSTVLREVCEIQTRAQVSVFTISRGSGPSNGNTPDVAKPQKFEFSAKQGLAPRFNYSYIDLRSSGSPKDDEKNDRKTPPF